MRARRASGTRTRADAGARSDRTPGAPAGEAHRAAA